MRELVGEEASGRLQVEIMDVLEEAKLDKLCAERRFASCIHFAGHKVSTCSAAPGGVTEEVTETKTMPSGRASRSR